MSLDRETVTLLAAGIAALVGIANLFVLVSKGHAESTELWVRRVREIIPRVMVDISDGNTAYYSLFRVREGKTTTFDFESFNFDAIERACKEKLQELFLFLDDTVAEDENLKKNIQEYYEYGSRTYLSTPEIKASEVSDHMEKLREKTLDSAIHVIQNKERIARLQRAGVFWAT